MPTELEEKIKEHLHTFPDRHKEVVELKNEWKEFKTRDEALKNRAIWVLISFAGSILAIGVWVGTIQTDHTHFHEEILEATSKQELLANRLNSVEVNNSEIKTRLLSIEATLQEIKAAIIKLQ